MYVCQMYSCFNSFGSLNDLLDFFKNLPYLQQIGTTLFDYEKNAYAEGKDFAFNKELKWRNMP